MIVVLLAIVKCVFPGIASNKDTLAKELLTETDTVTAKSDSILTQTQVNESNIKMLSQIKMTYNFFLHKSMVSLLLLTEKRQKHVNLNWFM